MDTVINNFNSEQKILKYTDKIDYYLNGHKTLIVTELDLTNRCNNNCPGCCGVKENGAELSQEQINLVIQSLSAMDCKGVILSGGGEPLISPHFIYALIELRRHGLKVGINSNGLALTEELAQLIADNCEYFRISLDAASAEMYQKTHGMPSSAFEQTKKNIEMFSRIKRACHSKVSFGVGFLTSEDTAEEMSDFVDLVKRCGADFAQFRPFTGNLFDITEKYLQIKENMKRLILE